MEIRKHYDLMWKIQSNGKINSQELSPYTEAKNSEKLINIFKNFGLPTIWIYVYNGNDIYTCESAVTFFFEYEEKHEAAIDELRRMGQNTHIKRGLPDITEFTEYVKMIVSTKFDEKKD